MSTLELASLLPNGRLTICIVERWITAALAQAAALHEHDKWLYPADPTEREMSECLHSAWSHWVADTKVLVRRAEDFAVTPTQPDLGDLKNELARAEAMLRLTPRIIAERREQARRGEVYSVEEVRRALHTRDRR